MLAALEAKLASLKASLIAALPSIKSHGLAALIGAGISIVLEVLLKF